VNGTAADGARLSVTVARNGDLIGEMYLELEADVAAVLSDNTVASGEWVAERAVADIELTIGGQRIDKHYQKWWRLYSELYLDEAKKAQYGKMASAATTDKNKVYLPLIFFFNRNPGLYLPLIALQYHEVRLDITLSSAYSIYFTTGSTKNAVKVWGNYVYLDTEERRRFAQKGHEYLIEQVQHTGVDTVDAATNGKQVRLSYNHPVKELVWCFSANGTSPEYNDMWDTSNADSANVTTVSNANVTRDSTNATVTSFSTIGAPLMVANGNQWVSEEANSGGPMNTFKLILNGQDRFKEQSGKYFNQVQPFYHHSGNPYLGIYSYSFALKPEEHQPTGTCNFSRIDNAQVEVKTKGGSKTSMHMFAVNYNVLRIQSGMGGLAFSN
jgi:hypothetical protein